LKLEVLVDDQSGSHQRDPVIGSGSIASVAGGLFEWAAVSRCGSAAAGGGRWDARVGSVSASAIVPPTGQGR
jgi:hypothetical protein